MSSTIAKPSEYRPNVAAIVIDERGRVLACQRSDGTGAWQFPQGGIEDGESPREALCRELYEEIGISSFEVVDELPGWITYEWPKRLYDRGYRGQRQKYFVVRVSADTRFELDHGDCEFSAVEWTTIDSLVQRFQGFKLEAYRKAIDYFSGKYPNLFQES